MLLIRLLTAQTPKLFAERAGLGLGGVSARLFRQPRFLFLTGARFGCQTGNPFFTGIRRCRVSARFGH